KNYLTLKILPHVAVVSEEEGDSILLLFKGGIKDFATIGVDPSCESETALTRLILAEKYDSTPNFVPIKGPPDEALSHFDGVLTVDRRGRDQRLESNSLDIINEWYDITELPYVHGFWALRDEATTSAEREFLKTASLEGTASFEP